MKVVTSGYQYIDIDAYGGCIAYAELLNLLGNKAVVASTAPVNESVTPTIRAWKTDLKNSYEPASDDEYVLVDISDPDFFDKFVAPERVSEVIDHHMDFVDYWQERLGSSAHIEFIGAACTLVFERWKSAGKLEYISETSARLLVAGILDNTLKFEASVTTERDRHAYEELQRYAHLSADWPAEYFTECQRTILADVRTALSNDSKTMSFPSYANPLRVGQLVVWDAKEAIGKYSNDIKTTMSLSAQGWFVNIVSIAEGKNYLMADNNAVQSFLENLLDVRFADGTATTDRLWLRKEIMKKDLDSSL